MEGNGAIMFRYEGTFNVICRVVRTDEEGNPFMNIWGEPWISKAVVGQVKARSRKEAKRMAIDEFSDLAVKGKPTVSFFKPSSGMKNMMTLLKRRRNGSAFKQKDAHKTKKKVEPTASEARAKASAVRADRKRKAHHARKNRTRRGA